MPVSPNAIPTSGPVSIGMLNTEFGLGYNLNAYKGKRLYNTANNSRRDIGTGSNAYVSMSDFRGYQNVSPVVAGSRIYLTSGTTTLNTTDTLPLFNIITFTVWAGGGGGGGGAITNAIYGKGDDGNAGTGGSGSYVNGSSSYVSANGGGGGGGGQRANRDVTNGTDGSGYDGAHGQYGTGGAAANNDGGTGATAGGRGGYGGKSSLTWNVDQNSSYLSKQNTSISIQVGGGGPLGTGNTIVWNVYPYPSQTGNSGVNGSPGYVIISWT